MFRRTRRSAPHLVVIVALVLAGPLATEGRGDFTLTGSQQLTVNTSHSQGTLYDQSLARIVTGGSVSGPLLAYNTSTVDMSGGSVMDLQGYSTSTMNLSGGWVNNHLYAYDTSTVSITGGAVYSLQAYSTIPVNMSGGSAINICTYDTSTVNMSGCSVSNIYANNSSTMNISGGSGDSLHAYDTSTVTILARDFRLGSGLSLDGDRVLGTGNLSGEWFDGSDWSVNIVVNDSGATILAVPEPATLSLLALGGLAMLRRNWS